MKTTVTHARWGGRDTRFPGYLGTLTPRITHDQLGWPLGQYLVTEVPNKPFEARLTFSHFEARNHSSVAWFVIYQPGHWDGDTTGDPEWRVTGRACITSRYLGDVLTDTRYMSGSIFGTWIVTKVGTAQSLRLLPMDLEEQE